MVEADSSASSSKSWLDPYVGPYNIVANRAKFTNVRSDEFSVNCLELLFKQTVVIT